MGGKEFRGKAFISKPETIEFKDYEVGKTHVQTILLTNVGGGSMPFNSFKLLPLNDEIKVSASSTLSRTGLF